MGCDELRVRVERGRPPDENVRALEVVGILMVEDERAKKLKQQ